MSIRARRNRVSPTSASQKIMEECVQEVASGGVILPHCFETDMRKLKQEEDLMICTGAICRMALPITFKRHLRYKLREKRYKVASDDTGDRKTKRWTKFKNFCWDISNLCDLWAVTFKHIEGHFGNGVASYFMMVKSLLLVNIGMFLLTFFFICLPAVIFSPQQYDEYVTGQPASLAAVRSDLADNCSSRYVVTVDGQNYGQLVLDFLQGTGWMEKRVSFYGFYEASRYLMFPLFGYTLFYNMPLAYLLTTLAVFLISLMLLVRQLSKRTKESLLSSQEAELKYLGIVFTGWEFSLVNEKSALLRHRGVYKEIKGQLQEDKEDKRRETKTAAQRSRIIAIRVCINLFVIALLAISGYLVALVTTQSTKLKESSEFSSKSNFEQLLIEYMAPITVGVLDFLLPLVFYLLIKLEDYKPEFQVKFTLIRIVCARTVSLGFIIGTLYLQISCRKLTDHCNVGIPPSCLAIQCWETYLGQQLYKLVLLDFLGQILLTFLLEFPRTLIVSKSSCKLSKLIGEAEFDIARNVLDTVFAQVMCWLGVFFCPLLPGICIIKFFIIFYLKKLTLWCNHVPSLKQYGRYKLNLYFLGILTGLFLASCLPIGFLIWTFAPSKGCGAFRLYVYVYDIWDVTVATFPSVIRVIFDIITSTTFFVCALILSILTLFYLWQTVYAYKDITNILNAERIRERRDKKYLAMKVADLTGQNDLCLRTNRILANAHAKCEQVEELEDVVTSD